MILPETARTLRTSDIGRATEHISRVFASHRLDVAAGARRLAVEHRQSGWPDASFNELCYGGQVLIEAPALLDFYMLQFTLRGCCEITQRRRSLCLPAGTAAVINPDCRYTKRWSEDAVQVIVRLSRTRLSRLLAGLLGREGPAAVEFAFAARDMHAQASYLWEIVKCLGPRAASDAVSMRETVHTAAVDHLLTVLLHTMPNSQQEALARDDVGPARPRFVRLAQDYIDANATERVTLVGAFRCGWSRGADAASRLSASLGCHSVPVPALRAPHARATATPELCVRARRRRCNELRLRESRTIRSRLCSAARRAAFADAPARARVTNTIGASTSAALRSCCVALTCTQ